MIEAKLTLIQNELRAPKSRKNSFGGYNYRSLEDICEALKPLLAKHKCSLHIVDSIKDVGGRVYVEATATLTDIEDCTKIINTASARESESKKGMDDSQITGATSSYARKYCLNGLFLIDDTKDADSDEYNKESDARYKKDLASEADKEAFKKMCAPLGLKPSTVLQEAGWKPGTDVTKDIMQRAVQIVMDKGNENNG